VDQCTVVCGVDVCFVGVVEPVVTFDELLRVKKYWSLSH
jgi:hypothetical protein